ncbi:hypothetical protein AAC387_Pa11g2061 [Persea americana]
MSKASVVLSVNPELKGGDPGLALFQGFSRCIFVGLYIQECYIRSLVCIIQLLTCSEAPPDENFSFCTIFKIRMYGALTPG